MAKSDMHFLRRILILAKYIFGKHECLKGFAVEKYHIKSLSVLSQWTLHMVNTFPFKVIININIIYWSNFAVDTRKLEKGVSFEQFKYRGT